MKQLTKVVFFFLLLIVLSIYIRVFIGEPTKVSSSSMEPTIKSGDWLWVNKVDYGPILPRRWADIPLLNIATWIPDFREKDIRTDWGYRRVKGLEAPKVNDIVVFNSPENIDVLLVKRISRILHAESRIYLDSANCNYYKDVIKQEANIKIENGIVYINDTICTSYKLKNSYYYLLGDNSSVSRDSRFFGYVAEKNLVGRVNRLIFSSNGRKMNILRKIE